MFQWVKSKKDTFIKKTPEKTGSKMFNQESKVAVLESKLTMYEDLSREMLTKLEAAVDKISEGNAHIAMILAKHDERIEQSTKTDKLLIKMIDEVKESAEKNHTIIHERIDRLQVKIESLSKFRWQVGGVLILIAVLIGPLGGIFTTYVRPPASIEREK